MVADEVLDSRVSTLHFHPETVVTHSPTPPPVSFSGWDGSDDRVP